MSYQNTVITRSTTELAFLQAFISALTGTDSRISCDSSGLAAQFADDSATPHFSVTIDNDYILTFERGNWNSSAASCYTIELPNGDSTTLSFSENNAHPGDNAARTWKFRIASNSECIYIALGDYNTDFDNYIPCQFFGIRNNAAAASAWKTDDYPGIIGSEFITDDNIPAAKVDRLPYTYDSSDSFSLEKLNGKVFVISNSTNKAFVAEKLHDVSTVARGAEITSGNKSYVALDTHTIMEV